MVAIAMSTLDFRRPLLVKISRGRRQLSRKKHHKNMTKNIATLEMDNGNPAMLGLYIQRLVKSQDLNAWKQDRAGFDFWLKEQVCNFVKNSCKVKIREIPVS